jgi:hypothetical protein
MKIDSAEREREGAEITESVAVLYIVVGIR